jgi:hypothetical protein
MTEAQETALLHGNVAKWVYFVLMELVIFFGYVSVSPSWMGIVDTRFVGPWGVTSIMTAIPFLIPKRDRPDFDAQIAQINATQALLLDRIKQYDGLILAAKNVTPGAQP